MTESVLVVPSVLLNDKCGITKVSMGLFCSIKQKIDNFGLFKKRSGVENDPKFKQIIPYVVFRCGYEYFVYQRGKKSGEQRLVGKYSLGIGGHINPCDGFGNYGSYLNATKREIKEEIEINDWELGQPMAIINDNTTDVGKVHFGIVHLCTLKHTRIIPKEEQIVNSKFVHFDKIQEFEDKFENWSKLFIDMAKKVLI
jgi:predicted NUDIX family phosphoesterase